jgi:predicted tellurium resistance membrane protein TerC
MENFRYYLRMYAFMFFIWVTGNLIMQHFFPEDAPFKIRSYYTFPTFFVVFAIIYHMITGKRMKNRWDEN